MNRVHNNYIMQTKRPINYEISKSLERKFNLDLIIGSLVAVKLIVSVINYVFRNVRSENKFPLQSFKLLSDF